MVLKAAKEIVIKGKVHDVGYRLFLLSEAERLFIEKFDARNVLADGEQHLVVLVEGAEDKISRFVEFAKASYPPDASVQSVEVRDYGEEVRSIDSFRQSFMVFQLTKIAQAGVSMLGKQDAMLGKQDAMLEKQDAMLEKQDTMLEKMDTMLEKQDAMLEKQDAMLEKQDAMLEKMDTMLEKQDAMLEKQDAMLEKQDTMLEKMDTMLEKQDETIKAIKEESEKTREVVKEEGEKTREVMREKLVEDVEWVKEEIIGIKATLSKVKEKVGVD